MAQTIRFTCDCGRECVLDENTQIAFGPGSYDLRCGLTEDCVGDEMAMDCLDEIQAHDEE